MKLEATDRDNFSWIETVEYSLDNEHWFKGIITSGFGERSANFRIGHPFVLEDGEYEFRVRAIDFSGNVLEEIISKTAAKISDSKSGSALSGAEVNMKFLRRM